MQQHCYVVVETVLYNGEEFCRSFASDQVNHHIFREHFFVKQCSVLT